MSWLKILNLAASLGENHFYRACHMLMQAIIPMLLLVRHHSSLSGIMVQISIAAQGLSAHTNHEDGYSLLLRMAPLEQNTPCPLVNEN